MAKEDTVVVAEKEAKEIIKAAPAAEEEQADEVNDATDPSKLERSILHQVEYYFGDANLMRDKFLLGEIAKDEEGWVPFSVLLTFKRLAALTTDVSVIVDALMKSDENLIEISEDKLKLRRHPERPIPEQSDERRKEIMTRTAYAKGFPLDSTIAQLVDFFAQFNKVMHVTMRKYLDKPTKSYKFKGSVFVTFEKVEQAKDFIEKEKIQFGDRVLLREWQEKYLKEKSEKLKIKSNKKKDKQKPVEEKIELPTGAVLYFENDDENLTRELLREGVEGISDDIKVAFIEFSKGEKEGYIRLQGENTAAEVIKKLTDNKLKLKNDKEIELKIPTEEKEKEYLEKAVQNMKSRRNNSNRNNRKGGGHHHGNRKRRGGDNSEVQDKKKKQE